MRRAGGVHIDIHCKLGLCLLLHLLRNLQCVLLESLQICHLHLDSSLLALLILFLDLIYIRSLWSGTNDDVLMRPQRQRANLAVFWLGIPLCFLFAQTVDFSGKIGSSGFLDYWLFFPSNSNMYPLHFIALQWVLELKGLIIVELFIVQSVSLKSTTNWELLNWWIASMQTSVCCSAEI